MSLCAFYKKLTGSRVRSGRWLGCRQLVAQRLAFVSLGLSFASELLPASIAISRTASCLTSTSILRPLGLLRDSDGVSSLWVFICGRFVRSPRYLSILLLLVACFRPRNGIVLVSRRGPAFPYSRSRCGGASSAAWAELASERITLASLGARLLPTVHRLRLVNRIPIEWWQKGYISLYIFISNFNLIPFSLRWNICYV